MRINELWKKYMETKPTQDELWDLQMAYEPTYHCANCGCDAIVKCPVCGSDKLVLDQTREEFEIKFLKMLIKEKK